MKRELKKIKTYLQQIEWGESVLKDIDNGKVYAIQLVYIDKLGNEICKFEGEDEFNRSRMAIDVDVVKEHLKQRMRKIREDLNDFIVLYAKDLKDRRKDKRYEG